MMASHAASRYKIFWKDWDWYSLRCVWLWTNHQEKAIP